VSDEGTDQPPAGSGAGPEAAKPTVLVVGGGFAGVGCATELGRHGVPVLLLDRNNYQQFQPLLYQVATAELGTTDVSNPLRALFSKFPSVDVKQLEAQSVDPATRTVTTANGERFTADYLVLSAGAKANFFHTPGARDHAFPLYTVADAQRLRTRIFEVFEEADSDASLIDRGALNFVIVGAGPTGVETAGALADLVNKVMPHRFNDLPLDRCRIYLVDHGSVVLRAFSDKAHPYAATKLAHVGVRLRLDTGVEEITADRVRLSDGTEILTRTVVWAGGITAADVAGRSGLSQGQGGRLSTGPDLSVEDHPNVFAIGDIAANVDPDGQVFPQLGSVALQAGHWAAENILADIDGKARKPFHYKDKGIMAMIGDNAAIAEVGAHHHELHGTIAFAAWLGVHAWLLSGTRRRVDAFVSWAWDFFGSTRASSVVVDPDAARIDWGDDTGGDDEDRPAPTPATSATGAAS
jgi:NADH dehydrogenase